jgi:MoaA/NifB/PqqE/SkfB family radical SAM enzyme
MNGKMDEKIKRLLQWSIGKKTAPYMLEIWPTFKCNLNCIFCAHNLERNKENQDYSKKIKLNRWLEILDEAHKMDVKLIRLAGGGEPMNVDDISLFTTKVKSYGMKGTMTTNGTLFDENLIKDLVKSEWDEIEFSVDGPNAEIHDYFRGKSFDKIIDTLKLFNHYKKKFGKDKPEIYFNTVFNKLNFDKIGQMLELASSVDCKKILLLNLNIDTPESEKLKLNETQIKNFDENISLLEAKAKKLNVYLCLNLVNYLKDEKKKEDFILPNISKNFKFLEVPCFEPWYSMQIRHDGLISPCYAGFFNKESGMHTESCTNRQM